MTQKQYLTSLLKERGNQGVNSFERFNGKIKMGQMPARVFYLEKDGLLIEHRPEKDTSTTYIFRGYKTNLTDMPQPKRYEFKSGVAYEV